MATCLVTGANRGIGLSLVRHLLARGETVIGTSRGPAPDLEATGARVERLDVADGASIAALAARLAGTRIDLLVNNAGILSRQTLDHLDVEAIQAQFTVNALGPLRVTAALRDQLPQGATVGIVTSRMGSVTDNTSGGAYGYRMSKAAVNMAGQSLAHDLRPAGSRRCCSTPATCRDDGRPRQLGLRRGGGGAAERLAPPPRRHGAFVHQREPHPGGGGAWRASQAGSTPRLSGPCVETPAACFTELRGIGSRGPRRGSGVSGGAVLSVLLPTGKTGTCPQRDSL